MAEITREERDDARASYTATYGHGTLVHKLLDALDAAEAERDEAQALIEAARVDVRAESFLEHAQAILRKCVAPYSCEQMKAVADVLASNFSKLELVRELADKTTEERAAAIARAEAAEAREAKLREAVATWMEWGGHCETCEFVRQRAANPELPTELYADYCDCGWHKANVAMAQGGGS